MLRLAFELKDRALSWIWARKFYTYVFALVLAVVLASLSGVFNWWRFYDHRTSDVQKEGQFFITAVRTLAYAMDAGPTNDSKFREELEFLRGTPRSERRQIIIERHDASGVLWRIPESDSTLDVTRTVDSVVVAFVDSTGPLAGLRVTYREAVRPYWVTSLFRAWSWSLGDVIRECLNQWGQGTPLWDGFMEGWVQWKRGDLFDRSVPVYVVFLPALLLLPWLQHYRAKWVEENRLKSKVADLEGKIKETDERIAGLESDKAKLNKKVEDLGEKDKKSEVAASQILEDSRKIETDRDELRKKVEDLGEKDKKSEVAASQILEDSSKIETDRNELRKQLGNKDAELLTVRGERDSYVRELAKAKDAAKARSAAKVSFTSEELLRAYRKINGDPEVNVKEHGSSAFLRDIGRKIRKHSTMKHYVIRINSVAYVKTGRDRIVVRPDPRAGTAERYVALIYSPTKDAANAAEIEFSAKECPAVFFLATVMRNEIRDLEDFDVTLVA